MYGIDQFFKYSEHIPIEDRVLAGSAWLDKNYSGWAENILSPKISSKYDCVLCYVTRTSGWKEAKKVARLSGKEAVLLGFDKMMCYEAGSELIEDSYKELELLWLKQIVARRPRDEFTEMLFRQVERGNGIYV